MSEVVLANPPEGGAETDLVVVDLQIVPLATAQTAYQRACALLRAQGRTDVLTGPAAGQHDLQGVLAVVLAASLKLDSEKKSKFSELLAKFSRRVTHYGSIIDVLTQHHPEYVSLGWGTLKLLFVLFNNHEELLERLVSSLTDISAHLEHVTIHEELYQDVRMQNAIAGLYALLIRHFHDMLSCFQEGPLLRAWNALVNPWQLRFKDLMERIESSVRSVNDLAAALSHQEQRDGFQTIQRIESRQQNMLSSYGRIEMVINRRFDEMADSMSTLRRQAEHYQTMFQILISAPRTASAPMLPSLQGLLQELSLSTMSVRGPQGDSQAVSRLPAESASEKCDIWAFACIPSEVLIWISYGRMKAD